MDNSEIKKVSTQQILAKTYIEENEIERIINEMLNSLVHDRVKDPVIYMLKYLAGLITEEEKNQNGIVIPGPYPKSQPIAKYPHLNNNNTSLLSKTLKKPLFNSIKFLKTKHGGNSNHILKLSESDPSDRVGCLLTDGDCLPVFNELFVPIINQLHNLNTAPQCIQLDYDNSSLQNAHLFFPYYQSIQKDIKSFAVSYSRNLKAYPYCNTIQFDRRLQVESEVITAIDALMKEKTIPEMKSVTYKTNQSKWNEILNYVHFDSEWNQKAQMAINWPDNRSIYYTEGSSIVILINFNDHFQLISSANSNASSIEMNSMIMSTKDILNHIERKVQFDYSKQYGYMNSSLILLGAGLTLSTSIQLNDVNLTFNDGYTLTELLKQLHFDSIEISPNNSLSISSSFKLSYRTEKEFIEDFYSKICGILHLKNANANNLLFSQLSFPKDFTALDEHIKSAYESTYKSLKYKLSSSGLNINQLLNMYISHPNNKYGIILQDETQLIAFQPFISKYLSLSQQYDIITMKRLNDTGIKEMTLKSNKLQGQLSSIIISVIRNIDGYPFPTSYLNQNSKVEALVINALNTLNMKEHFGDYFSLDKPNERDQAMKIIKENSIALSTDDKDIDIGSIQSDFPSNRGVIQFAIDNSFAVVNDVDHLKFYITVDNPSENLNEYLYVLLRLLNEFSKQIKFAYSKSFGILSACPKLLGTGLTIAIEIELSKINKEFLNANMNKKEIDFCIDSNRNKVVLTNKITIGRNESEIYNNMLNTVNSLLESESNN